MTDGDPARSHDIDPRYGELVPVAPGLRRMVAENPSRFTFRGTGTYVVGAGRVAVIDPGPKLPAHIDALADALAGETVTAILVTHTHLDHSPAARPLQARLGGPEAVPIYGCGPHAGGDPAVRVEEGADRAFAPDRQLADGETVADAGGGWTLEAVHTPGHTANHLCFAWREAGALFSGDHVMGWSTSVISPPDGDMAAYLASLERLRARPETRYYPTHGGPIADAHAHVDALVAHRRARERQILAAIADGRETVPEMVDAIYTDIPESLKPAAARSVLAHLVMLADEGRVACDRDAPDLAARYRPA